MSMSSSPQQIVQAQLGRRFATVPKDQLHILDHDGAWAIDPHERRGVPPVPAHVLQDITSNHLMRLQAAARKDTDRGPSPTEDNDDEAGEDGNANKAGSQEHEEDEGSLISGWSASPTREPLQPISAPIARDFQTQILQAAPDVGDADAHLSVSRNVVPSPAAREAPRPVVVIEQEEDEDEEEMEVDLPGARESSPARVNLESARVQVASTPATAIVTQIASNQTPSCAQPDQRVIPGTVLPKQPRILCEEEPKRRSHRRMRPIQFEGTTPVKRVNSLSAVRLPATSRLADVDSSMSTSSSSRISATCATNSTQHSAVGHTPAVQIPTTEPASPPSRLHQSSDVASTRNPPIESVTSQRNQESPPAIQDTYSLFKSAYPSYTTTHAGTLKNFVKAILCLEYLQSERALHEFLYDDFIRAFSSGYLHYVRNAGPGQEALPAIEWFNLRDGQPEFTQMIITKRNVKATLEEFPEEVSRARQYIGGRPQGEKGLPRESKKSDMDATIDIDENTCQTRHVSVPETPEHDPRSSLPSPQLGSDARESSRVPFPPTSSARLSKTPGVSLYFERMKAESRNRSARPGSVDHQARLREHFRQAAIRRQGH
ncbi:hypothetical protein E4U41_005984 [Claviceps citrina]|nr:hypothetical protein E4U41_005984 [Claviceps citrina]